MSLSNRDLAELYFAKFPHDETLADEAFTDDFVFHHLRDIRGRNEFREFMRGVSRAFPDFRFEMHHYVDEGALIAAHYTFAGTQHDTFLGTVESRGHRFATRGMSLFSCRDGRIGELWVAFFSLAMMQQLGAVGDI
jgi:predicted ester cyclase